MHNFRLYSKGALIAALVLILLLTTLPSVEGRRPRESIIVKYHHPSGLDLTANLTYTTENWYFDVSRELMFNFSMKIPDNTTLSYSIRQRVIFLDFEDEDYVYFLVNDTKRVQGETSESFDIPHTSFTICPREANVSSVPTFQMEISNAAVLGFLIIIDLVIDDGQNHVVLDGLKMFSHNPNELTWTWPSGMNIAEDNEDRVYIRPFYQFLMNSFTGAAPFLLLGAFTVMCLLSVRNSEHYIKYKASKPEAYIRKSSRVHGQNYKHGMKVSLAYYMYCANPGQSEVFRAAISAWAKRSANLDLHQFLDSTALQTNQEPIWASLENQLARNAHGIDEYLYERFSRGSRASELISLLKKQGFLINTELEQWIIRNIDEETESEMKRFQPSGELFAIMRYFVEDYLDSLIPGPWKEMRDAVEKLEKEDSLVVLGATALSCRTIIENLLYALVTEEIDSEEKHKYKQNMTRDNMSIIIEWLKSKLNKDAETPIVRIDKGFDYFFYFTEAYIQMIQRSVHKKKSELQRVEIIGLVVGLYSWISNLLILIERAKQS